MQSGTYLEPNKLLVGAYLDHWLDHMKSRVVWRTLERHVEIARKNIGPLLGSVRLTKLRPAYISAAYSTTLANGTEGRQGRAPAWHSGRLTSASE